DLAASLRRNAAVHGFRRRRRLRLPRDPHGVRIAEHGRPAGGTRRSAGGGLRTRSGHYYYRSLAVTHKVFGGGGPGGMATDPPARLALNHPCSFAPYIWAGPAAQCCGARLGEVNR